MKYEKASGVAIKKNYETTSTNIVFPLKKAFLYMLKTVVHFCRSRSKNFFPCGVENFFLHLQLC